MPRILGVLAAFAVAFLVATMFLGLALGDVSNPADRQTQQWAVVHRLSGVSAALVVVLVDSIAITYFVGTSRWCREVVETYALDAQYIRRANQLKRRTFPIATVSMLVAVAVVALGGAADPAAALRLPPPGSVTWAQLHLLGALAGIALMTAGFVLARNNVVTQQELIQNIMLEVRRVRQQRGLPVE